MVTYVSVHEPVILDDWCYNYTTYSFCCLFCNEDKGKRNKQKLSKYNLLFVYSVVKYDVTFSTALLLII